MPPDHPRSRGEYSVSRVHKNLLKGSSPLSRGIHAAMVEAVLDSGIIPALAGNTVFCWEWLLSWRDHPRSRGEYAGVGASGSLLRGSSPLSRGIRLRAGRLGGALGIIPALAGNTCPSGWPRSRQWDHPRSRGEYPWPMTLILRDSGSSPLSRGILRLQGCQFSEERIIPALAGNTLQHRPRHRAPGDHPRSRGEYPHSPPSCPSRTGSSPLSRGIPATSPASPGRSRIIPALAGNTRVAVLGLGRGGDHPRSRGEYGRCRPV